MTFPEVVDAEHLSGYRVRLRFTDGADGDIDLGPMLAGEIFGPLRHPAAFQRFHLQRGTLVWENGADFAPATLRARIGARGAEPAGCRRSDPATYRRHQKRGVMPSNRIS